MVLNKYNGLHVFFDFMLQKERTICLANKLAKTFSIYQNLLFLLFPFELSTKFCNKYLLTVSDKNISTQVCGPCIYVFCRPLFSKQGSNKLPSFWRFCSITCFYTFSGKYKHENSRLSFSSSSLTMGDAR